MAPVPARRRLALGPIRMVIGGQDMDRFSTRLGASLIADRHREAARTRVALAAAGAPRTLGRPSFLAAATARIRQAVARHPHVGAVPR